MIFFIFSLFLYTYCDIPVHCEFPSIVGSWTFSLTEKIHNSSCVTKECDIQATINPTITKTMTFQAPNLVTDENGFIGTWTLIYDQGFEIIMQSERYLAYFKYTENPNAVNFTSHCDETFIGWYHRDVIKARKWGCFYGKKISKESDRVTYPRDYYYPTNPTPIFRNDMELVSEINNNPKKSFSAKLYPHWEGQNLRFGRPSHPDRTIGSRIRNMDFHKRFRGSKKITSLLPKAFDWRNQSGVNYVSPVRAQLMCGSCYSFSTMGMFEARQRIFTNNEYEPVYSIQDVLDCSQYSQGCDGGFAYLVAKYGMDFGIVDETCDPYRGEAGGVCTDPMYCKKRTYVYDYHYTGGYYGATTEENMMNTLIERGPLSVSLNVFPDLKQYREGVYTCPTLDEISEMFEAPTPKFFPTDHCVLIVGYGEDNGEKYWIVKNSWGLRWGNEGYFWIRKGTNECNIETLVVSAEIVNNNDME